MEQLNKDIQLTFFQLVSCVLDTGVMELYEYLSRETCMFSLSQTHTG